MTDDIKNATVTTSVETKKSGSGNAVAGAFLGGISGVVIVIVVILFTIVLCCCACFGISMIGGSTSTSYDGPRVVSMPGYTEHGAEPAPATPATPATPGTPANPGTPATPAPANPNTPAKFKVGDVIALDDFTLQVNAVDLNVTSDNTFLKPDAGNKYIAADVKVTNKSSSSTYISSFSFDVKDAEGFNYDADIFDIKEPALPSKSIANGDSVRGWVTFEVSQKSKSLELVFTPGVFSAKTIVVALE
jgi:hypothetical protein